MPEPIDTIINTVAAGPRRVQGDEGSVEQHSIADLIKLAQYQAGKTSPGGLRGFGIRRMRAQSPSALGD